MPKPSWTNAIVGIIFSFMGASDSVASETPPASIEKLWEQHMLGGTFVVISLEKSGIRTSEIHPPQTLDPKNDEPTFPSSMTHPISIEKLDEGLFGNGGWILAGGLLQRLRVGSSAIELYGKKIIRRHPYFPFPFHRDPPQEVSYEFFLLLRTSGVPLGHTIRKWTFPADKVIQKNPNYAFVRVACQYDEVTHSVVLKITGLEEPFEERIDVSRVH
jgi:hypothetical protein